MSPPIYLDYQATTPVAAEVVAAMAPYWSERFGNPHSVNHRFGWEAEAAVDGARGRIAAGLNAEPESVIFTSGATEANNLALKGVLEAAHPARRRLVTVVTEHSCIVETAAYLARQGVAVTMLPVEPDGLLDPARLQAALGEDVALVSVMAVNNEIGVIQPLARLAQAAHAAGALFHTDAAQAFGKLPLDVRAMGVDLMSLSAHKTYGPKGVGALYVRKGVRLAPQMHGGGQERGLRAGTLAPALCVGFGAAAMLACDTMDAHAAAMQALWLRMTEGLRVAGIAFHINGCTVHRWFGNLNLSFPGLDGSRLIADMKGVAVSSGAACASAAGKGSYVLPALGLPAAMARAALRIGFGRPTTADEIDRAVALIVDAVRRQTGKAA